MIRARMLFDDPAPIHRSSCRTALLLFPHRFAPSRFHFCTLFCFYISSPVNHLNLSGLHLSHISSNFAQFGYFVIFAIPIHPMAMRDFSRDDQEPTTEHNLSMGDMPKRRKPEQVVHALRNDKPGRPYRYHPTYARRSRRAGLLSAFIRPRSQRDRD